MRSSLVLLWLAAVVLETCGNAAGFLPLPQRGQWLLGLCAMLGYGVVCMMIARRAPHFLQAWPLGYACVYFLVGLLVAKLLANRFSKFEIAGAVLIVTGFAISLWGQRVSGLLH